MKAGFEELNAKLEAATVGLVGVSRKRVFSRNTFFVDGKLFALVWREGRIGVKLPDAIRYAELEAVSGAQPWVAWGRTMAGWLLVPTEMHGDSAALARWVKVACEAVRAAAPAPAQEGAVARLEPVPSHADVPKSPPLPKASAAPRQPPPLPKAASLGPKAVSAPPIPKPPPSSAAPVLEQAAPSAEAEQGFSFGEEPAETPAASPVAASSAADEGGFSFGDGEPAAEATPSPADAPAEFSFDGAEPAPASQSGETGFDFGGGEPEPPSPAAAEPKKKKGKGKKRTG